MKTKILDVRQKKVIDPVSELYAKDILIAELKDALEFSERVAAKLAGLFATISLVGNTTEFDCESSCPAFSMCCTRLHEGLPCDDAILMYVRLAVEEEMDGLPV